MKTYYIYHIANTKIGCTSQLAKRMRDQEFTEWEILEEHTDIYVASDREIELQKEYGLPVDTIPYWKSVANRFKMNSRSALKARDTRRQNGTDSIGGLVGGKAKSTWIRKLTQRDAEEIRSKYIPYKYHTSMLAKEYNVSKNAIVQIINNLTYLES